ncbi:MAG: hypothetical protein V4568_14600 [Pseudomonadota bacterium]
MSGGSYDYACSKMYDMSESIRGTEKDPRRAAFAKLLKLVADAAHDVEWVDSCDYGKGDEHKAIDACFAYLTADCQALVKARAFDELSGMISNYLTLNKGLINGQS